jgi:hypothetical protein
MSDDIEALRKEVAKLKKCIRWYRAFAAQAGTRRSVTLIYLFRRAEEAYHEATRRDI